MAFRRTRLPDFDRFNLVYSHATVTAWNVVAGAKGTTKITLYDDITGTGVLANPQTLSSRGHWGQDLYVDEATILEVTDLTAGNHDSAVIYPRLADDDVTQAIVMAEVAIDSVAQADKQAKRAATSAAAAAASAASISDEGIALAAFLYGP